VYDVLARQAGDVGARCADVFALNHCNAFSLLGKGPQSDFRSDAAADDDKIKSSGSISFGRGTEEDAVSVLFMRISLWVRFKMPWQGCQRFLGCLAAALRRGEFLMAQGIA
jgi:hypothetical protein